MVGVKVSRKTVLELDTMRTLKFVVDGFTNALYAAALIVGALTICGDWLFIYVHWLKLNRFSETSIQDDGNSTTAELFFRSFYEQWTYVMISSYGLYFSSGLLLHYIYYKLRRERAHEWKCQPQTWLSTKLEMDEIKSGCKSLLVGNTSTAFIAWYILNDGYYSNIYFKWDEYSLVYLLVQIPVVFILSDCVLYWVHRIFHWPILYKLFHSSHHRYRQPTAFSSIAIHPVEMLALQYASLSPFFNPIFPIYFPVLYGIATYFYLMGILNHSGIDFKPWWWQPWQPETMFHDNHHQYFHVNFGFNLKWWDRMHGTMRKVDRIYTEETFWGKGKPIKEASPEERANDFRERQSESENAHAEEYRHLLLRDHGKWL